MTYVPWKMLHEFDILLDCFINSFIRANLKNIASPQAVKHTERKVACFKADVISRI